MKINKQTITKCLILLLVLGINKAVFGQAQRYVDLNNKFLFPQYLSTVYLPDSQIHIRFRVLNQGPDTLFPEDTMAYKFNTSFLSNKSTERKYIKLDKIIVPGDSIIINEYLDLKYEKKRKYHTIFWVTPPIFTRHRSAPKGEINYSWEERKGLDYDNFDTLLLQVKERTIGISEVKNTPTGIYPNPLQANELFVYTPSNKSINIRIFNTLGKVVKTYKNRLPHTPLNIKSLNAGYYIVELTDKKGKVYMHKLQRL